MEIVTAPVMIMVFAQEQQQQEDEKFTKKIPEKITDFSLSRVLSEHELRVNVVLSLIGFDRLIEWTVVKIMPRGNNERVRKTKRKNYSKLPPSTLVQHCRSFVVLEMHIK